MADNFWAILRKKSELSQSQFAAKSGISLDMVRDLEGGRRSPSLETATKAAEVVGMRPVAVLVAASVESAQKSVERGEGTGKLLRTAAKFADLAEAADEEADAQILVAGGEELLAIARSAGKSAGEDDVDGFGRKTKKRFSTQRTMLNAQQDSRRPDELEGDDTDIGVDIHGRKVNKIYGR